MGLFGGDSIIGLDIGTTSIKAVRIQATGKGWQVVAAGQAWTPRGAIAEGMVADEKAILPALKNLLTQGGMRGGAAVAAVNFTSAVLVRRAALPVATPVALRKQIKLQPDQLGLSGGSDYIHDFQILGVMGEGDEAQMDTVLVSAPRASVEGRLRLLESAGIDASAIDIEPFGLMRSLVECKPAVLETPGATAILDMGAAHTDVTVVSGPNHIFTRAIPYGGEGLTEVVRQALGCSPEDAETLKTTVDLNWLLQGPDESTDETSYKATQAVKSVLDDLLKEVRNSILFYQSQLPEDDVEGTVGTILLAGGTALMRGLADYMQSQFSPRVERADFSQGFAYGAAPGIAEALGASGPLYALALGLAVKEPLDRAREQAAAAAKRKPKTKKGAPKEEPQAPAEAQTPEAPAPAATEGGGG